MVTGVNDRAYEEHVVTEIREHLEAVEEVKAMVPEIARVAATLASSLSGGGKLLFCGNGGSAADAQHLAAEFTGRFLKERAPFPALALHANSSGLTAIGNDYGFDEVFARNVRAFGRPNDVLVAISTSGNSANVVKAARVARDMELHVVGMTGSRDSELAALCHDTLRAPSASTPRIQEVHILIGHILCGLVEDELC